MFINTAMEYEEVFWFHIENADALDEIEVPVYCFEEDNLETDVERGNETEEDNRYIELPVLGAEELLSVDEPVVVSNGFNGMLYIYLPEQWAEMCRFLESKHGEDRQKWIRLKRYFFGASCLVRVQDRRLYIPRGLLIILKIKNEAVLMRFTKDNEHYYALRNASL